jgi:carboxyl-terminal processing protease
MLRLMVAAALVVFPSLARAQETTYEQMQLFSGVLSHVRLNYVDSVDSGRMIQASIRGMLGALDPHSYYMSRQEFDLRARWDRGELGSPGFGVDDGQDGVTVTAVAADGPAARAGIQPGDRVVRIGDVLVRGMRARAAEAALLGDKGSKVRMTLERGDRVTTDTFVVTLKRAVVKRRVIGVARLAAPRTAYVQLNAFTPTAPEELARAIRKLDARELILDLRGNGGGDMEAMTAIASSFLPEGAQIFRTEGRRKMGNQVATAKKRGAFLKLPLILLIDAGSASASEILAGSLQDQHRALIVGRQSFGKALVQTSLPLPNGDVLWLTTARILTPSGRIIQRRYEEMDVVQYLDRAGKAGERDGGIQPDVIAPAPDELPGWFAAATEAGLEIAVADSVAASLPATDEARRAWMADSAGWDLLVTPFMDRVRSRLGTGAAPAPLRARLGHLLGHRVAATKWGEDGAGEFVTRNDPDVKVALAQVARLSKLGSAASDKK